MQFIDNEFYRQNMNQIFIRMKHSFTFNEEKSHIDYTHIEI